MRGTELAELGSVAGAGAAARFGSETIGGVAGVGTAVAAGQFIPNDFPGHCLYRLFDKAEYDEDVFSAGPEESKLHDLKITKCAAEGEPDTDGTRKKCNLNTGAIVSDTTGGNYDNRHVGTCVAWQKSSDGKCIPVSHSPENLHKGLFDELMDSKDINCNIISDSSSCNDSEYCYWRDQNPDNFNDIYFCLNDIALINVHNEIVNGEGENNLIDNLTSRAVENHTIINSDTGMIQSLQNFTSEKETDINDICNNYCTNGLCSNIAITSMPLIPGVANSAENVTKIIRLVILFIGTFSIWYGLFHTIFNFINSIISKIILMIMMILVYIFQGEIYNIINDFVDIDKDIEETILPFIEEEFL